MWTESKCWCYMCWYVRHINLFHSHFYHAFNGQFVHLVISDWLEVLFKMKDVLNFAIIMPGAPFVMMVLMKMMLTLSVASLATQTKVTF